ncbi:hypothetical protein JTE90_001168 [Oedothorax gibbosus]|uniref:Uncharacterized protein n=1 Tax=Oedothorax gibbosus TaxID=931172 RepID=A0AAV6VHC2_9ARAC|nr:hypothetical protein JTE90_001168 [Oedothorax gibbosus]
MVVIPFTETLLHCQGVLCSVSSTTNLNIHPQFDKPNEKSQSRETSSSIKPDIRIHSSFLSETQTKH